MSSFVDGFITCFFGGAPVLGASNSFAIFSELFECSVDRLVLFVKFTRLDAPVTLAVCDGFSCRFTAEQSATFGDAFRGGNGGAVKFELIASLAAATAAETADPDVAVIDAIDDCALTICCCCCCICPDWAMA